MKRLFLLAIATLSALTLSAQTAVNNSYEDVSFGAGLYMNSQDNSLQYGTVYSVDYGRFNYNNIGFRGGVSYIDELGRDVSMIGLPLRFAWRSGVDSRLTQQKVGMAAYSFIASGGDLPSALMNLAALRFDVSGGLTPMVATSRGGTTYGWSSSQGDFAEELSVRNGFALSADLAARLNVRVWRVNIFFEPQYHYWLTNNFKYEVKTDNGSRSFEMPRSYMSFLIGLNFIL